MTKKFGKSNLIERLNKMAKDKNVEKSQGKKFVVTGKDPQNKVKYRKEWNTALAAQADARTVKTGKAHGIVTVFINDKPVAG